MFCIFVEVRKVDLLSSYKIKKNIIMENLRESVIEQLNEMDYVNLVEAHNTYCNLVNDNGSTIHLNDQEGLQMLLGNRADCMNFAFKVFHGDYNPYHTYVKLDGDENLESFNDPTDYIETSDMVETIIENMRKFKDILDLEY